VTFGKHLRSDGTVDFTAMSNATFNASNSYPRIGPLVINEIMYNPAASGHEYIELLNIASSNIPLFDMSYPTNTWRLRGAVDYDFPTNTFILTNEAILIVDIDPDQFRQALGISNLNIRIFGGFSGDLANNGENVKLLKPNTPELDGTVPYVLADRVEYDDNAPWPMDADGNGASLERRDPRKYGNDPTNWAAATYGGTPGTGNNTAGLPTVAFADPTARGFETNTTVYIPVSLYPVSASTVTVDYVVSGGNAVNGSDYALTPGSLTFWPNEISKLIPLRIIDDSSAEPNKTIIITLTNLSPNAIMGGNRLYTYTIVDTDPTNMPAPSIYPAGGNFYTSVVVSITSSVANASIYYTTDGTMPTSDDTLYSTSFVLNASAKVSARTFMGTSITGNWTTVSFYEQTPPWTYDPYTIVSRVNSGSDDCSQKGAGVIATGGLFSTSLPLSRPPGGKVSYWTGLRFNGINVPKGGVVTNAYILFTSYEAETNTSSVLIYAEATNNASTFLTNSFNVSTRNRTTSSVNWNIAPWYAIGQHGMSQRTPQLTNIINEVLSRPDWAQGNSIGILITNVLDIQDRWFISYDGDPTNAPVLYMQFIVPSSAWLSVQTNGLGTITGGGNQWHSLGSNVTLYASPGQYRHFGGWSGDTGAADTNSTNIVILMDKDKSITGKFDPDFATNSTPVWWIEENFPGTNDYNNAAMEDIDGDGMPAWEEYIAGTMPTNSNSVLRLVNISRNQDGSQTVYWKSVAGKLYSVYRSTNLLSGWLYPPMASDLGGESTGTNNATDSFTNSPGTFYRIHVE